MLIKYSLDIILAQSNLLLLNPHGYGCDFPANTATGELGVRVRDEKEEEDEVILHNIILTCEV